MFIDSFYRTYMWKATVQIKIDKKLLLQIPSFVHGEVTILSAKKVIKSDEKGTKSFNSPGNSVRSFHPGPSSSAA